MTGRLGINGNGFDARRAEFLQAGLWIVQTVVCVVVQQQCFGCIDGRVQLRTGIQVLPVEVHASGIGPAKTTKFITIHQKGWS